MTYDEMVALSFNDIADLMDLESLPQPEQYFDEQREVLYPTFPDALRDVQLHGAGSPVCVHCNKTGYYYPADKAYAPGHVYSEAGMIEFTRITSVCEFCFDHITAEPEDEDEGPAPE